MPLRCARALLTALLLLSSACERAGDSTPRQPAVVADTDAQYVGAEACAGCHTTEAERWRSSHHALAMQRADAASVLGDFGGTRFADAEGELRFLRRDGRFLVSAPGPGGERAEYEVAYTFGVDPLQQYLVPFPGGRLQVLGAAWDARPREQGGQRWFSLHPGERVTHQDVLYWTKPSQNWNARCAECHSTDLRRGYDAAKDVYDTRWTDVAVACEACHGPGSRHVAWARERAPGDRGLPARLSAQLGAPPARWTFAADARIAHREPLRSEHAELEACAPCHARRSVLVPDAAAGGALLDAVRPTLLDAGLYEADGQIREEVYEYGSFVQSPMYRAGVTCSDCHDPHALRLRAEGNALCAQCHRSDAFDTPAHHHHAAGSAGAACVACHMPARTYMQVDVRHDHSFRVPRPDLSAALGTPNTCTDCHRERKADWAARATAQWFPHGRSGAPHYASALDGGRRGLPGAEAGLARLAQDSAQPAIARASALALFAATPLPPAPDLVQRALADDEPLVRLGALEAADRLAPEARLAAASAALADPLRSVRVDAAQTLAAVPAPLWSASDRAALGRALAEYRATQEAQADLPEARVNLGLLDVALGEAEAARAEYAVALRLAPWFVPAAVNLADLERANGREGQAEAALRRALAEVPDAAAAHHALGLLLIRTGRRDEARRELARAAQLAPDDVAYAYAYALALHDGGDGARGLAELERALALHPHDAQLRFAAATLARDLGRRDAALRHAHVLADERPELPAGRALVEQLEGPR